MKIIFMGTPEFAVPSLEKLINHGYDIVAVITATDKLGGRGGKQLLESPVKQFALKSGIPVLQPAKLKASVFLEELASYQADLQVVVAFRMLPEEVWSMPRLGTINLHGSLLPKYRGAAPINWAIINGEKETGVTTFFIKHEIDTGDLLFQESMNIGENETAGEVHDRMSLKGAELVLKTVRAIEANNYELKRQDDSLVSKAPKIFHETCVIDFNRPSEEVHNFIRGLSPYPGAWMLLNGEELKILRTLKCLDNHNQPPGRFFLKKNKRLCIATAEGSVEILELQLQGRKRMQTIDFLNGYSNLLPL
jgi:methionyl-tRNA formyltransferase